MQIATARSFGTRKKVFIRQISFILLFVFISCASIKRYGYDRTMDASDIVNIGIERNIYGISVIILGPIRLSLQKAAGGKGIGVRYGHLGTYETGDDESLTTVSYYTKDRLETSEFYKIGDNWLLGWVSSYHKATGDVSVRNSNKNFTYASIYNCMHSYTIYYQGNNHKCTLLVPKDAKPYSMELSLGAYLGIRIGINLEELVDFFAGIVGYDLEEDDTLAPDPETIYFNLPQSPPESSRKELK